MKQKIKVSVIMPFLNSITYLKECMDSVINQTLKEIEIICVDAGSIDGTLEILHEYAEKDERIKIINSDKKSYGYQINLGLRNAQGEYFGIVESDDVIKEEMYKELYDIANKYKCDAVKSDFYIFIDEAGQRKFTYRALTNIEELYNKIINPIKDLRVFRANGVNTPGIYSMEFIKNNRIELNETPGASFQDNGLWFQIFSLAKSVYLYDKPFYMIRRDNPNSSVKNRQKVYCLCDEYDFIRNFLKTKPEIEKKLAPVCTYFRYGNYLWTLDRIADELKLEFCKRFSEDFKKIKKDGDLDKKLFNDQQLDELCFIMQEPEKYYFTKIYKFNSENITLEEVIKQNIALSYKIEELKCDINNIKKNDCVSKKKSIQYYIQKCKYTYQNYGLKYTMKKVLEKIVKG